MIGAKIFIAQNRPLLNPPFTKRIGGYLRRIAVVAIVALVASANLREPRKSRDAPQKKLLFHAKLVSFCGKH
jgi:hypothetical protein